MRDLRSFIRENQRKNEKSAPKDAEAQARDFAGNTQGSDNLSPEEIMRSFEGKSKSELMGTLMAEVARKRSDGSLTNAELDAFSAQVAPMLDEAARSELFKLISTIKSQ